MSRSMTSKKGRNVSTQLLPIEQCCIIVVRSVFCMTFPGQLVVWGRLILYPHWVLVYTQ